MNTITKNKIITDFETMKSFEESARDFYLKVYADTNVRDKKTSNIFKKIADDEQRHVEAVDKILGIIKDSL